MPESFADAPVSIAELRASKEGAAQWTPRDVLVSMLRDIDSGKEAPFELIVVYREASDNGGSSTYYVTSTKDLQSALGLLEYGKFLLFEGRNT